MSNLSVNTITDASGGSTASINGLTPQASNMQPFNRIINGAMTVDQRNAGAAVSTGGSYPVDRSYVTDTTSATFTSQRSTTAPTGFTNSLLFTVGTGASASASDQVQLRQQIEGFNIADLGWGTANAKTVTLSFQVRASLTGTYCVFLQDSNATLSYVAEYTISVANTFESKSITIDGPTTGTFDTVNSTGVMVGWDLGSGSNFNTTAGTWQSSSARRTTNQANFISTNGATFYITGVQLEAGSSASSFAHEFVGDTLRKCQRYYQTWGGDDPYEHLPFYALGAGTVANFNYGMPVEMRAAPSLSTVGTWTIQGPYGAATHSIGSFALGNTTKKIVRGDAQSLSGSIGNYVARIFALGVTNVRFNLDAEL